MKRATAEPAFSIKVREGTPKRSEVARSMSRISAALTIFIAWLLPSAPGCGVAAARPWRSGNPRRRCRLQVKDRTPCLQKVLQFEFYQSPASTVGVLVLPNAANGASVFCEILTSEFLR